MNSVSMDPRMNRNHVARLALGLLAPGLLVGTAALAQQQEAATPESAVPAAVAAAQSAPGTLERIRTNGRLTIAYRSDARPLSFNDPAGKPAGYTVELCQRVADALKTDLQLGSLEVNWLPVTGSAGILELKQSRADLLCGELESLEARKHASFSVPVFPAGVGALLRSDAPERLRTVLAGEKVGARPLWRGATAALDQRTFAVVEGSPVADWLAGRIDTFKVMATIHKVGSIDDGVQQVLDGEADVLFGERTVLLDALNRSNQADSLSVIGRQFTLSPVAIGMARGEEDLRFAVDRALSRLYRSPDFSTLYTQWFGPPDQNTLIFFHGNALPD